MMNKVALAKVNGNEIFADDIDQMISVFPPEQQPQLKTREGRRNLLNELVSQKLLYQEALDQELDQTQEFQDALEEAKESLLKTVALSNLLKTVEVEDQEIQDFYDSATRF